MGQVSKTERGGRKLVLGLGLGALVLIATLTLVTTGVAGVPSVARALDAVGLLEQRSPGERGEAALSQVKRPRQTAEARQRARSRSRDFAPADIAAATGVLGLASPEQLLVPAEAGRFVPPPAGAGGPPAAFSGAGLPPVLFAGGGSGGGGAGGTGGGGSGDLSTETTEAPETPPPPPPGRSVESAVPEPGTWATMLVGMALCGFGLRRRRKHGSRTDRPCAAA